MDQHKVYFLLIGILFILFVDMVSLPLKIYLFFINPIIFFQRINHKLFFCSNLIIIIIKNVILNYLVTYESFHFYNFKIFFSKRLSMLLKVNILNLHKS